MWDEFEDVGSLNLDTDKFDDLLAPQFSDSDSDDFLELFFETWEPPELPESEIETPQPVDPDYWYNDWFPMD